LRKANIQIDCSLIDDLIAQPGLLRSENSGMEIAGKYINSKDMTVQI
jgi:hypothetical protein